MRPVLVERVVDVDEQRADVLDLGVGVGGLRGQHARELEEVEEEGFDEAFELEGAVGVGCVFGVWDCGGGLGGGIGCCCGGRGGEAGGMCGWEVEDALFLEGR